MTQMTIGVGPVRSDKHIGDSHVEDGMTVSKQYALHTQHCTMSWIIQIDRRKIWAVSFGALRNENGCVP
jgi:hypothetical protein